MQIKHDYFTVLIKLHKTTQYRIKCGKSLDEPQSSIYADIIPIVSLLIMLYTLFYSNVWLIQKKLPSTLVEKKSTRHQSIRNFLNWLNFFSLQKFIKKIGCSLCHAHSHKCHDTKKTSTKSKQTKSHASRNKYKIIII